MSKTSRFTGKPGSRIEDRQSMIENRGSGIGDRRWGIGNRKSVIGNRGIGDRGSVKKNLKIKEINKSWIVVMWAADCRKISQNIAPFAVLSTNFK